MVIVLSWMISFTSSSTAITSSSIYSSSFWKVQRNLMVLYWIWNSIRNFVGLVTGNVRTKKYIRITNHILDKMILEINCGLGLYKVPFCGSFIIIWKVIVHSRHMCFLKRYNLRLFKVRVKKHLPEKHVTSSFIIIRWDCGELFVYFT